MDPLGRLRDLGRKGLLGQVTLGKEVVDFGDGQTFPRDAPTAFRSSSSNSLYLLESVVFAVLNEGLAFGKLRKKARDEGVKTLLTVVDTRDGQLEEADHGVARFRRGELAIEGEPTLRR